MRAAVHIREEVNSPPGAAAERQRRFEDVLARYEREEMPKRAITKRNYQKLIRIIRPAFGHKLLSEVKPQTVRTWLLKEFKPGRYRGHIHDMMRRLFKFAMLWEWYPIGENPMSLFSMEGSSKRAKEPRILTTEEIHKLLAVLPEPILTAVIAALCLGLRCSELFGLKWFDFDFHEQRVMIQRSFVEGHVDDVKTRHSKRWLPLHPALAHVFLQWRSQSEFKGQQDWVFASPAVAGEMPYYPNMLQYRVLRLKGREIGLDFSLGWHTFRHTYKTLLDERGVELTVQRDLMRHADVRTTAQVYGDVSMDRLRGPNGELVEQLLRRPQ
jgi:integrase